MPGVGNMSVGYGPFGNGAPSEPVEPITTAVSSRTIDTVLRDYVTDQNGNPPAMDGTAVQVYLLASYNDQRSDIITPTTLRDREKRIQDALDTLTQGLQPTISNLVVQATKEDNGMFVTVTYLDNQTQQPQTVIIR